MKKDWFTEDEKELLTKEELIELCKNKFNEKELDLLTIELSRLNKLGVRSNYSSKIIKLFFDDIYPEILKRMFKNGSLGVGDE